MWHEYGVLSALLSEGPYTLVSEKEYSEEIMSADYFAAIIALCIAALIYLAAVCHEVIRSQRLRPQPRKNIQ